MHPGPKISLTKIVETKKLNLKDSVILALALTTTYNAGMQDRK